MLCGIVGGQPTVKLMMDRLSNLENWTVVQLKELLLVHDVPISNPRKDILVKSCYEACMFRLKPKMTNLHTGRT